MKVVKYELFSSNCICQNAFFTSKSENLVQLAYFVNKDSMLCIWYLGRFMALFNGLGSKQRRTEPSALGTTHTLLTQSVGSMTFSIIFSFYSFASSSLTLSSKAAGNLLGDAT